MSGLQTWLNIETEFLSGEMTWPFLNFVRICSWPFSKKSVRIGIRARLPLLVPGVLVHNEVYGNTGPYRTIGKLLVHRDRSSPTVIECQFTLAARMIDDRLIFKFDQTGSGCRLHCRALKKKSQEMVSKFAI